MTLADQVGEVAGISPRHAECLQLIAQGLTSKEIARRLNVSPSTVDNHVSSALGRLGVRTRAEAVRLLQGGGAEGRQGAAELTGANDCVPQSTAVQEPFSWRLPPFGGPRNAMPVAGRYIAVIQVALLGIMMLAAATFTIVGIVNLLSR